MIRAFGSAWPEVEAEASLRASFGYAWRRRAAQVGALRHRSGRGAGWWQRRVGRERSARGGIS